MLKKCFEIFNSGSHRSLKPVFKHDLKYFNCRLRGLRSLLNLNFKYDLNYFNRLHRQRSLLNLNFK